MPTEMRYSDEFKRDAISQVVDRGYIVLKVANRLGITTKLRCDWPAQFGRPKAKNDTDVELRRLKAELTVSVPFFVILWSTNSGTEIGG